MQTGSRKGVPLTSNRWMGSTRSLWETLAFPETNVFARFEDGLHVPLDTVVASDASRRTPLTIEGHGVLSTSAYQEGTWAFPTAAFLDSGRARIGHRVAADDPHILELGALGMPSFF